MAAGDPKAESPPAPLLYSQRPEWADITPVAQYETLNPLAPIFYTEEYRDATDCFRGIVKAQEMSPRVLELTEHIIRLNPAHYSAWQYRYKTIMATKSSLTTERRLMDELAVKFLKTYQVWHHRRLLLLALRASTPPDKFAAAAQAELDFVARSLGVDTKNYHTWSFRQWVLASFDAPGLWDGELPWTERLLADDVRNNSAWHHRFFVVFDSGVRAGEEDRAAILTRELRFVKEAIALAPNNPSAWNYLRGVLDRTQTPYSSLLTFVQPYAVAHPAGEAEPDTIDLENPPPSKGAELPCPFAMEFLAEIREGESAEGRQEAAQLYKVLADEKDTIRKKYWDFRAKEALACSSA